MYTSILCIFKFHLIWGLGIWQALSMQRRHACAFGADLRTALHPLSASGAATWTPAHIPLEAAGSPYHIASYRITEHNLFVSCQVWHIAFLPTVSLFPFYSSPPPPSPLASFCPIFVFTVFQTIHFFISTSTHVWQIWSTVWMRTLLKFVLHPQKVEIRHHFVFYYIYLSSLCLLTSFTFSQLWCITTFPLLHGRI